jgi:hypothetical protein
MVTGATSTGTVISGNYIGLYSNGTSAPASGNQLDGILLNAQSTGTRIGGTTAGERNVISGMSGNGIEIAASNGNTVQGNYIGTDSTGMVRSTTVSNGILVAFSDNNTIGGTQGTTLGGACTGACNVISGNGTNGSGDGIGLNTANGNTIDGNYIGLNSDGTASMLNGITTNGGTFNGKAIRLLTSNNNQIGRPHPTPPPEPEGNVEFCTPTNTCTIQDDFSGNFWTIDNATGLATFTDCYNGTTSNLQNITFPISTDIFTSVPSGYVPDAPFNNRHFGESSFSTFTAGARWRWTGPSNPFGVGFIPFYRWYGDREGPNLFAGLCPHNGNQLTDGGISIENNSFHNIVSRAIASFKSNITVPLTSVPHVAIRVQNSDDTTIDSPRLFGDGTNPLILVNIDPSQTIRVFEPHIEWLPVPVNPPSPYGYGRPFVQAAQDPIKVRFPTVNLGVIDGQVIFSGEANTQFHFGVFRSETLLGLDGRPIEFIQPEPQFEFDGQSDAQGNVDVHQELPVAQSDALRGFQNLRLTASKIVPGTIADGQQTIAYTTEMSTPIIVPHAPFNWDRDGKTDIAVYRPGVNNWYRLNSSNNSFNVTQFGSSTDKLVTDDYTGDGQPDFAVFRPSNATWYIARVGGTPAANFDAIPWGTSTDTPVTGDFDGDGRNDIGVFRPSNGTWYIRSTIAGGLMAQQWGISSDVPVPANYDGDNQTDIAVFRNGTWYISPCTTCALRAVQFGVAGDIPVPADYDGDGRDDIAVFRPSTGVWYLLRSTSGFAAYQWGTSTDVPAHPEACNC